MLVMAAKLPAPRCASTTRGPRAPSVGCVGQPTATADAEATSAPEATSPPAPAGRASRGHLAGLDGLRALAIVAVVVFHLDPAWLPGGFLGVDVFFVISGFLITTLLVRERRDTGRVDLRVRRPQVGCGA